MTTIETVTCGVRDENGKFLGSVQRDRPEDENLTGGGTQEALTFLTDDEIEAFGIQPSTWIRVNEV